MKYCSISLEDFREDKMLVHGWEKRAGEKMNFANSDNLYRKDWLY